MEQRPHPDPERRQSRPTRHERGHGSNSFFGLDVEGMSPEAQVAVGAVVVVPVLLAVALVLALAPEDMRWLVFAFGWTLFPAFGLLLRGIAGVLDDGRGLAPGNGKERELLGALREHGELTPAQAALETSLTVSEADEMLEGLAEGGHLEVRARGGRLFYALWEPGRAALDTGEKV